MLKVANLSTKDREALFRNTAQKMGLNEAIVEKDFWVCWTLNYLFQLSKWKNHFSFKGGTSLSKSYGLIERFSEDIDLILDWRLLGYALNEPWYERSKTKQDQFNKDANRRTADFLVDNLIPSIYLDFKSHFHDSFDLYLDKLDPQTIIFAYPQIFNDDSIQKVIRIEIGVLASWTPATHKLVKPYVSETYPHLFSLSSTNILTVSAERTFWEKITILHKEAHRTNGIFPERYSRHYYDVHCMSNSQIVDTAISDIAMLDHVTSFKSRFYPAQAARYELAKPGTLKLLPPVECMTSLHRDYNHMQNMIFGKKPTLSEILVSLMDLETKINTL